MIFKSRIEFPVSRFIVVESKAKKENKLENNLKKKLIIKFLVHFSIDFIELKIYYYCRVDRYECLHN